MIGAQPVLSAAQIGAGGLGLIVVVLLMGAAVVIFIAMSRSLKRLHQSVDRGSFDQPQDPAGSHEAIEQRTTDNGDRTTENISRDQAGPGGAAV